GVPFACFMPTSAGVSGRGSTLVQPNSTNLASWRCERPASPMGSIRSLRNTTVSQSRLAAYEVLRGTTIMEYGRRLIGCLHAAAGGLGRLTLKSGTHRVRVVCLT
ncbi:hypothetical protein CLAIMM_05408, partial [Cladophialophora immunda]